MFFLGSCVVDSWNGILKQVPYWRNLPGTAKYDSFDKSTERIAAIAHLERQEPLSAGVSSSISGITYSSGEYVEETAIEGAALIAEEELRQARKVHIRII